MKQIILSQYTIFNSKNKNTYFLNETRPKANSKRELKIHKSVDGDCINIL